MPKTHRHKAHHTRKRHKKHAGAPDDPMHPSFSHGPTPAHRADRAGVDPRKRFKATRRGRH